MKRRLWIAEILILTSHVPGIAAAPESPNLQELRSGWTMASAKQVSADGAAVSAASFDDSDWYSIAKMPATGAYSLIFKGINYRAEIWLNGHRVAGRDQVVRMYPRFEFDVTSLIAQGSANTLAVKITPEQGVLGECRDYHVDQSHEPHGVLRSGGNREYCKERKDTSDRIFGLRHAAGARVENDRSRISREAGRNRGATHRGVQCGLADDLCWAKRREDRHQALILRQTSIRRISAFGCRKMGFGNRNEKINRR